MRDQVQTILNEIAARKAGHPRPLLVAICGGSASGKSLLSRELEKSLCDEVTLIHQDDFQLGEEFPERGSSPYRWDDTRNFDPHGVRAAVGRLLEGRPVEVPVFDLGVNRRVATKILSPRPVILLDGLYSLRPEVRDMVGLGVYIEAQFYGRFVRRVFRFMEHLGVEKGHIAARHMLSTVYKAHQECVAPQRPIADMVIRNPVTPKLEWSPERSPLIEKLPPPNAAPMWTQNFPDGITIFLSTHSDGQKFCRITIEERTVAVFRVEEDAPDRAATLDWFSY